MEGETEMKSEGQRLQRLAPEKVRANKQRFTAELNKAFLALDKIKVAVELTAYHPGIARCAIFGHKDHEESPDR